jgi:hypothetical protein
LLELRPGLVPERARYVDLESDSSHRQKL